MPFFFKLSGFLCNISVTGGKLTQIWNCLLLWQISACGPILTSVCSNYIKTTEKKSLYSQRISTNLCVYCMPPNGEHEWPERIWKHAVGGQGLHLPGPETLRPKQMWKNITSARRLQGHKETMKALARFSTKSAAALGQRGHAQIPPISLAKQVTKAVTQVG